MKFLGKTNKLWMGGTVVFTIVLSGFLANIQPYTTKAAIAQIAQALSPEEVNLRAKQIIVRIDGASVGSGSLVDRSDNVYTVLSNWHVMKNQGKYIVRTIDGRQHQVDPTSIKQLAGLDLAIFQFTSNQNYQVAELGDSANLNEGQSIYFAGYPGELRQEDNRYYRFFSANLVGILPKLTENGYSLIYNGEAFPGMSGSPVFNQEGLVIGVHGEANVHALSGGTSNYAIPISTYQKAIASLKEQPPTETSPTPSETTTIPETSPPPNNEVATQSEPEPEPEPILEEKSEPETNNSESISSVPTFTPDPPKKTPPQTPEVEAKDESESVAEPEMMDESVIAVEEESNSDDEPVVETEAAEVESETIEVNTTTTTREIVLVSQKTGINYKPLRDLLKEEKWSEADLQTYRLIEQIVQTAKQKNKHVFIELKTIAEFSCPDIRTIDSLWKKYTGNKFGFSSQQEVWQSVNQKGDFSTQTWRRFATQVGWKKGEVDSGSGYLLYDQLDFDPTQAPIGHLPWWFALPDEEQNVIKHLFARCNFNPSPQELAAEEGRNKPKKPRNNNADEQDKKPNIDN
ncbi:GUN4 domain-containing protein [Waterburya agarophytonicola K14]|uniref:GUN4 domain-containing protein n=1 Tax=Waterburya agarophytonicola KI4 TaxID=2874699 RepID=A0A964BMK1_9CYAN|nr:GUN4 domain-containing protein [Waterburya agarophytonicola]MCC0176115.1 GUN4 domain-containing protein [Waterburya agarophytonicola KI4]